MGGSLVVRRGIASSLMLWSLPLQHPLHMEYYGGKPCTLKCCPRFPPPVLSPSFPSPAAALLRFSILSALHPFPHPSAPHSCTSCLPEAAPPPLPFPFQPAFFRYLQAFGQCRRPTPTAQSRGTTWTESRPLLSAFLLCSRVSSLCCC